MTPRSIIDGMPRFLLAALAAAYLVTGVLAAGAGQDDPRLNALFAKLKTGSGEEARDTERQIWQIWVEHKNPEIARLMQQGMAALNEDDAQAARDTFGQVVRADKNFAEGWNKRATVEFVMGDFDASVADIERTLALEPRHFGALSGLGQIYLAMNKKALALKALRAALAVDPHLDGVREKVDELKKEVEGSPI
jgi:tetratricopeptide (TPR) repeat protein